MDKEFFDIMMEQADGKLMTALENQVQADVGETRKAANILVNHILDILDAYKEFNEKTDWIPVSSGNFPDDMVDVQVTFIGAADRFPHCEAFAYRNEGQWYWSLDDEKVSVEITAWKQKCDPYWKDL